MGYDSVFGWVLSDVSNTLILKMLGTTYSATQCYIWEDYESSATEYFSTICTELKKFFTNHEKSTAYPKHSKKKYPGFWQTHVFVTKSTIKLTSWKLCGFPSDNTECASQQTHTLPPHHLKSMSTFQTFIPNLTEFPLMKPSTNWNATMHTAKAHMIYSSM